MLTSVAFFTNITVTWPISSDVYCIMLITHLTHLNNPETDQRFGFFIMNVEYRARYFTN